MLAALLALLLVQHVSSCSNILVSKGASADGSVIVSYNADDDALFGSLDHRPALAHAPGSKREVWDCAFKAMIWCGAFGARTLTPEPPSSLPSVPFSPLPASLSFLPPFRQGTDSTTAASSTRSLKLSMSSEM